MKINGLEDVEGVCVNQCVLCVRVCEVRIIL